MNGMRGGVALAVLLAAACGSDGPTAPEGTNLAGRWQTGEHKYGGGADVRVYFEFTVDPTSTQVTSLRMRIPGNAGSYVLLVGRFDDGSQGQNIPLSVPITGGAFEVRRENPNVTCNGTKLSYTFSAKFRSETTSDGEWKDTNLGPPGYDLCGTVSFDWEASKR